METDLKKIDGQRIDIRGTTNENLIPHQNQECLSEHISNRGMPKPQEKKIHKKRNPILYQDA